MTSLSAFCTAFLVASVAGSVPAQAWEPIDPDLRNLRGICYLPVYPSREGAPDYYGVASSTAMWFEYDADPNAIPRTPGAVPQGTAGHVYQQLGWLKGMGINTVRVWLSFPLWEWFHDHPTGPTNEYVDRLRHFVTLCEHHRIYVMPVLWGSISTNEPDYADPIGPATRSGWHPNPGPTRIAQLVGQNPSLVGTRAELYLDAMVRAFTGSRALLLWDIMNEPHVDPVTERFVLSTLEIIGRLDPGTRTNIALIWAETLFPFAGRIARSPHLDTLGIHPYGHTRATIEAMLWDATHIDDGNGGYLQKPVIATEIGKPGWAASYADALRYAAGVPRPDLGPGERGMGSTPWGAMIGWEGGNFPFMDTDGILYGDGSVRDPEVITAFVRAAENQGVPGRQLVDPAAVPMSQKPGRVQQNLPIQIDDFAYLERRLWQPQTEYSGFSWVEYQETCAVFRAVSLFLDIGLLSSPANPVNDPTIPGNVISRVDYATLLWYAQNMCVAGPQGLSPELISTISTLIGVPFDPANDPVHLSALCTTLLHDWRVKLLPYVALREGPY